MKREPPAQAEELALPAVPGDLVEFLDRHFPAHLPVDSGVAGGNAEAIKNSVTRIQGRRDVVDFLRQVRAMGLEREPDKASEDGARASVVL